MFDFITLPLQLVALPLTIPLNLVLSPITLPLRILSFPLKNPVSTVLLAGAATVGYLALRAYSPGSVAGQRPPWVRTML